MIWKKENDPQENEPKYQMSEKKRKEKKRNYKHIDQRQFFAKQDVAFNGEGRDKQTENHLKCYFQLDTTLIQHRHLDVQLVGLVYGVQF